ncbi:MAG: PHP domain-containing protein [Candidatus Omnitrophica bacterium]|nr:PHP domain-containing protein [Candidatus Omnitrophota bacterium]
MQERLADLHIHTTYSDSSFTPEQAIRRAKEAGLSCVAITDHDSVDGLEEAISAGNSCGVEVIPAVEVSAEENGKELHMLGYFIDYKDEKLKAALRKIRDDRKHRVHKMVELLNKHGFDIDAEDVIKFAGDISISRLHIAQYMEKQGLIPSWREAFKKYIGDSGPCYVSSFRYSARQVVDMIKDAKGIPVIAHPGLNRIDAIMTVLLESGIEGVEAYHLEHRNPVSSYYEAYAKEHNLLITGGSDCHGMIKGKVLMGKVGMPYSYVEALKSRRRK